MKLKIKQKFMTFVDTYNILDENNQLVYIMKDLGNLGCLIYNNQNEELVKIEKVKNLVIDDYLFIKDGKKFGELLEKTTLVNTTYVSPTKNWTIMSEGLNKFKYKIIDENNQIIMSAKRNIFHITYHCELNIEKKEDIFYCIMIACALCSDKIKRH